MTSHHSYDTLNKMDSILNKELSRIGENKPNSPSWFDKDNTRSFFASTDTFKTNINGTYHSRRSSNCGERSPRVTFKDTPQVVDYPETDMNFKMQKLLLNLQAKVIELEMKMSSMNSPTLHSHSAKTFTTSNRVSLANTMESSKLNSRDASPRREAALKSSLRTTLNHNEKTAPYSRVTPILQQDNLGISRISHQESEMRILARSPSGVSTQTVSRSTAKKSVRRELRSGYGHNESGMSCNSTIKSNCSGISRSSKNKKEKENMRSIRHDCEDEGVNLHKLINKYKREYNEDKAALVKERIKGNELAEEVEKLNRKMKKMEKLIGTASKTQDSYGELIESFDKSENIRRQQRNLIESLNKEVRLLRGEKEIPESDESSFKTASSSKRSKSKRKTAKAF